MSDHRLFVCACVVIAVLCLALFAAVFLHWPRQHYDYPDPLTNTDTHYEVPTNEGEAVLHECP